jgi:hypothetical protein
MTPDRGKCPATRTLAAQGGARDGQGKRRREPQRSAARASSGAAAAVVLAVCRSLHAQPRGLGVARCARRSAPRRTATPDAAARPHERSLAARRSPQKGCIGGVQGPRRSAAVPAGRHSGPARAWRARRKGALLSSSALRSGGRSGPEVTSGERVRSQTGILRLERRHARCTCTCR